MRTPSGSASGRSSPWAPAARLLPTAGQHAAINRLADLVARVLRGPDGTPVAVQVSLLTDVQTIAGGSGLPPEAVGTRSALADSLCTATAAVGGPLAVNSARTDARVASLSPVTSGAVGAYLGVPLTDPGGEIIGALCAFCADPREWSEHDVAVLEDLAAAVASQLELQAVSGEFEASRARWEVAAEAAGVGTFDWDLPSGRVEWDDRMQALLGHPSGEPVVNIDQALDRVHPEDRAALDAAIASAVAGCDDFRAEFRSESTEQRRVTWLAARGRALPGPDNQAVTLIGTAHDITELREARDEAARLLERMATGFLALDQSWTVTYLNTEGARAVGVSAEDLVGRVLWEAFPGLESSEFGRQYKRAVASSEPVEFEAYYSHLDLWFQVRAVPERDGLSLYFLEVSGRHLDQQRAAAVTGRLELLARVGAELAAAGPNVENAVAGLGRALTPLLADWCMVSMIDGEQVRDVACWHSDPLMRPVVERFVAERMISRTELGAVDQVRRSRRPVVKASGVLAAALGELGSERAKQALVELAPESYVIIPLVARENLIGMLSLCRGAQRAPMSEEEIATASEVGDRAALALDSARLYAAQRNLAEVLQRSLLTTPPEPDHCEIVVRYVPAAEVASVGGDWFDSFLQDDGATVLVIGDVMGHDTAAAAAMGQVRSLLRGIAWHTGAGPADVLTGLDAAMEGLAVNTTASAVIARLEQDPDERERGITKLRWSNAGHLPPMLINPDGSVLPLVGLDADLLLGIDPGARRTESVVAVDRDSTVLLYTDGLVERRGQDLDEGLTLLRQVLGELAELPLNDLCDELLRRMLPLKSDDDVALVAVRLHRQDRPRPREAGPERLPPNVEPE